MRRGLMQWNPQELPIGVLEVADRAAAGRDEMCGP